MKKLFTLLLLGPIAAFAQPTLNAFTPTFGDSMQVHEYTYALNLNFPTTGNQNWDFSSYAQQPVSFTVKLINPATAPDAASYPTANIGQSISMGGSVFAYLYGRITADSLWSLGVRYPTFPAMNEDYTNPNVSFRFPWSLNGVVNDISESTQGTIDTTEQQYVGWGNIITPHGTYNNVVLISGKKMVNGVMTLEDYKWISAVNLHTVAEVNVDDSTGYWYSINVASSVGQEKLMSRYDMKLYPNPSREKATLAFTLPGRADVSVDLIALTGQRSLSLKPGSMAPGTHRINLGEKTLAAGTYFVRLVIDGQPMVQTLEILP